MFDNDFFSLYCFCRALVCMQLVFAFFDTNFQQQGLPVIQTSISHVLEKGFVKLLVDVSDSRLETRRHETRTPEA